MPEQTKARIRALSSTPQPLTRGSTAGLAALERRTIAVGDLAGPEGDAFPATRELFARSVQAGGSPRRSHLAAPVLVDGEAVAVVSLNRLVVAPFTAEEVAFVERIAEQMALAIGNARLTDQLEQRNRELAEALENQQATSEVLEVISRSPESLDTALQAVADAAMRLCHADGSRVRLLDGDFLIYGPYAGYPGRIPGRARTRISDHEYIRANMRLLDAGRTLHQEDYLAYIEEAAPPEVVERERASGVRTQLMVPLMGATTRLGTLVLVRVGEVRPFSEREIALAESFAAQAAIAIANARLLSEVTEALEQQTAVAGVLQAISRSAFDLEAVLGRLAEEAARLCGAPWTAVWQRDGSVFRCAALSGPREEVVRGVSLVMSIDQNELLGRLVRERRAIAVVRRVGDPAIASRSPAYRAFLERIGGVLSAVEVPLIKDDAVIGMLDIGVPGVERHFTAREMSLLQTFANQAVIAIENARLFEEVQERNRELTETLEQQTATSDVLGTINGAPTELQPVLDALVDSGARLCNAESVTIFRLDAERGLLRAAARSDRHSGWEPGSERPLSRAEDGPAAVLERRTIHLHGDLDTIARDYPRTAELRRETGFRSSLAVPLLRRGEPIGLLHVRRQTPEPFTERQVALIQTFADQAVIAIENARLFSELRESNATLREALEQQTATAEVLSIISQAPADLRTVLQTVAEQAARICDATDATINRLDGDDYRCEAHYGDLPLLVTVGESRSWVETLARGRSNLTAAITERRTVHLPDLQAPEADDYPISRDAAARLGQRTSLAVPILHDGNAIGAIMFRRVEQRPFTERQIAMLETFASQAAIAIENARLYEALQARNRELTDGLERERATGEVLGIISRSPVDLDGALSAIIERAVSVGDADFASVWLVEGNNLVRRATNNAQASPSGAAGVPIDRRTVFGAAVREGRTVHVPDNELADPEEFPFVRETGRVQGIRTTLTVPLMREATAVGALVVARAVARPFSEAQIALAETFADQAVIAIENARLFEEIQAKTQELEAANDELTAALHQQEAVAGVLEAISRAPTDVDAALAAIVDAARRLVSGENSVVFQRDGARFRRLAVSNPSAGQDGATPGEWSPIDQRGLAATAMREGRTVRWHGTLEEMQERYPDAAAWRIEQGFTHARTVVAAPLFHGDEVLGALLVSREPDRDYTDEEVALIETFASQAAIAIQNARLFDEIQAKSRELEAANRELREALERETATGDVLRIISRSPTDIEPVLTAVVERAARLCGAVFGRIWRVEGDMTWPAAVWTAEGGPQPRFPSNEARPLLKDGISERAMRERRTVHLPDVLAEPEGRYDGLKEYAREAGIRSVLSVPLVREASAIGTMALMAGEARPFTPQQIALVETFADQAVIAIENARLFEQLQKSNASLRSALERQTATSEVLEVISRTPTDLQAVLDAICERCIRLMDGRIALIHRLTASALELVANKGEGPLGAGSLDRPGPAFAIADRPTVFAVAALERRTVHSFGGPDAIEAEFPGPADWWRRTGDGSMLATPLVVGDAVFGVLSLRRSSTDPFAPEQVALMETFARQAAIAIENTRLFAEIQAKSRELEAANTELTEALEQQTATADVLRIISRAPADLDGTLAELVQRTARLYRAFRVVLPFVRDGEVSTATVYEERTGMDTIPRTITFGAGVMSPGAVAVREQRTVIFFGTREELLREFPNAGGASDEVFPQARLAAPLVRAQDGTAIGAIIAHRAAEPFNEKEAALLRVFADQAAIAIENARLFEEIQQRTRELEAASRAKSEFLSRMSHELRTPLNAIIGFAEIMELDPATTDRQQERVHHILQGGRHLLGLINEVLDITRIEAGRLSVSLEPVRLDTVVQEVFDLERPLAAEAEVTLALEDPAAFRVAVQADRQRLRQVVLNLVANAIKYNQPGGSVTLSVSGVSNEQRATSNEGGATGNEQRATSNEQRGRGGEQRAACNGRRGG